MGAHIHVATLAGEAWLPGYLVARLAARWREQGHRVTVGPADRLDADLGILHVDRTRVPESCVPGNPEGRPLLNGAVLDISKRRVSTQLVDRETDWTGPVIVKTNANYFAFMEPGGRAAPGLGRLRRLLGRAGFWRLARQLPREDYPILESPARVPGWVWGRKELVVERFLPERVGEEFALRVWVFFGDREYGARLFGRHPVVKVKSTTHYEYIDTVPEALRAARAALNMDFGKFDYVVSDGRPVLLDVNKTPTVSATHNPNSRLPALAEGLAAYLEQA